MRPRNRQTWHRAGGTARRKALLAPRGALAALALCGGLIAAPLEGKALEVAGVSFEPRQQAEDTPLELSGAGLLRYRIFIKAYVAALYVEPGSDVERVLDDVPKRIEIEYFWAIPADALRRVTREQIARGLDNEAFAELAPAVEELNQLYEDIEPGDRLSITYLPGRGTELAKNGVSRGVVPGEELARELFGLWLGDDPLDEKLRSRLLAAVR